MTIKLLSLLCLLNITAAYSFDNRDLQINIKGFPSSVENATIYLKTIVLQDGTLSSLSTESPLSELILPVPSTALLITASYFSRSQQFDSYASSFNNDPIDIAMSDLTKQSERRSITSQRLVTYPPKHGKAIGYNPDDFKASGPGIESFLGKNLSLATMIDLNNNKCKTPSGEDPKDDSFVVVESANPKGMAMIESELSIHNNSHFDPLYRVTPHIIAYTHLLKGNIIFTERDFSGDIWIEDLKGNNIAAVSVKGTKDDFWDNFAAANKKLSRKLCKNKGSWMGTIEYTRYMPTDRSRQEAPDFGSGVKVISYKGHEDMTITTTIDEYGNVSSQVKLQEEMTYSSKTTGTVTCGSYSQKPGTHATNYTKYEHRISNMKLDNVTPLLSLSDDSDELKIGINILRENEAISHIFDDSATGQIGCEANPANETNHSKRNTDFEGKEFEALISKATPDIAKIIQTIKVDDYTQISLQLQRVQ